MDVGQRTQMVMDRVAFESDPEGFIEQCQPDQDKLTAKLVAARERLPKCVLRARACVCVCVLEDVLGGYMREELRQHSASAFPTSNAFL